MSDVLELDDYRKEWDYNYLKCEHCDKEWMGVYHMDSEQLECPKCHKMTKIIYWTEEQGNE